MTKSLLITGLTLILTTLALELSNVDLTLQKYLYNNQLKQWLISKDNAVLDLIFYSGFKMVLIMFAVSLLITLVFFYKKPLMQDYRKGMLIVLLALIIVPSSIGGFKSITNVPCPKQLQLFGGNYPYVTFLKTYPSDFHQTKKAKCFPAGHASGGFALMSLIFLFKTKRNRYIALSGGIISGWVTGGYKMMIGDHFFSHTFVSMLAAWMIILTIAILVNKSCHTREIIDKQCALTT